MKESYDELDALGFFAKLVNDGSITPAQGLVDAINKNWSWAKDMLAMVEKANLRLIFVPARGKVQRHVLSIPADKNHGCASSKTLQNGRKISGGNRYSTIPTENYLSTLFRKGKHRFKY